MDGYDVISIALIGFMVFFVVIFATTAFKEPSSNELNAEFFCQAQGMTEIDFKAKGTKLTQITCIKENAGIKVFENRGD